MTQVTPLEKKYHVKALELMLEAANDGVAIRAELQSDKFTASPILSIVECKPSELAGFKHYVSQALDSIAAGSVK